MARTDEAIKRDLIDELFWDYRVDSSDIQVGVSHGNVTLTGTVPNYPALRAATNAAWSISEVVQVNNLMRVHFPTIYNVPTDDELRNSAQKTLAWNPNVYSLDIDVNVEAGKVKLEGAVDVFWKRWLVEDLVSRLRGVVGVENHLAVTPRENILDKDIARDVEAALKRNQYVDAGKVTAVIENGRVTLTGTVQSYFARSRAYDAAAFTEGVVEVDNHLVVA